MVEARGWGGGGLRKTRVGWGFAPLSILCALPPSLSSSLTAPSRAFFALHPPPPVQVQQDNKEGKLWLMLRKHGKFGSDDCMFVLENFVRNNPEKVRARLWPACDVRL
jgi:hypothetical protein